MPMHANFPYCRAGQARTSSTPPPPLLSTHSQTPLPRPARTIFRRNTSVLTCIVCPSSANSTQIRLGPAQIRRQGGEEGEEELEGEEEEKERGCSVTSIALPLEKIITCLCLLCAIFIVRVIVGAAATNVYKKPVPMSLKFPAWEGPVVLVQYLAFCDATVSMIPIKCTWWIVLGAILFTTIPLMVLGFAYFAVRNHIRRENLRFIRYHPFNSETKGKLSYLVKENASMKKGCFGRLNAWRLTFEQVKMRGEWDHDPSGDSAAWSFLISNYVGHVWIYAITRLVKKVAMSAVMKLTDGALNASLAIAVQLLDTICVLSMRPHIGRDTAITECLSAIADLLLFLWLALPVLHPETSNSLSDSTALLFSLTSTCLAVMPILMLYVSNVVAFLATFNILHLLGAAQQFVLELGDVLCGKTGDALQDRLSEKLKNDLELEQKSVRLQIMLERPVKVLTKPHKVTKDEQKRGGVLSRHLYLSIPHYECPLVYIRQAVAFVAGVTYPAVTIQFSHGPPTSTWEENSRENPDARVKMLQEMLAARDLNLDLDTNNDTEESKKAAPKTNETASEDCNDSVKTAGGNFGQGKDKEAQDAEKAGGEHTVVERRKKARQEQQETGKGGSGKVSKDGGGQDEANGAPQTSKAAAGNSNDRVEEQNEVGQECRKTRKKGVGKASKDRQGQSQAKGGAKTDKPANDRDDSVDAQDESGQERGDTGKREAGRATKDKKEKGRKGGARTDRELFSGGPDQPSEQSPATRRSGSLSYTLGLSEATSDVAPGEDIDGVEGKSKEGQGALQELAKKAGALQKLAKKAGKKNRGPKTSKAASGDRIDGVEEQSGQDAGETEEIHSCVEATLDQQENDPDDQKVKLQQTCSTHVCWWTLILIADVRSCC